MQSKSEYIIIKTVAQKIINGETLDGYDFEVWKKYKEMINLLIKK